MRQGKLRLFAVAQILVWVSMQYCPVAFAKKSNQAVYEEPFDLAGGGASLTRASQEGVMFANPALMPYGQKFFRWFGSEFTLLAAKESIDQVRSLASGSSGDSSDGEDSEDETQEYFDAVFETPVHFGATGAMSFISNNFGVGTFMRFEPDISGQKHNESGVPEFRAQAEGYGGIAASGAGKVFKWLSLGVTAKHMYVAEPDIIIDIADQTKVSEIQDDPTALQDEVTPGRGTSADAGALIFLQGYNVDYRFALKVDDIGDTSLGDTQDAFKQTFHAGMGVTFHNAVDSIHFALDFRDIAGAYGEPVPMRVYAGVKVMLRNFFGLAAGFYQGYPSYGVRLDLIFVKLGFTVYGRELGEYIGDEPRTIYMAYFGFGV